YNSELELELSVENECLRFLIAPMMHYAYESQLIIVSVAKIVTSGYDNELLIYSESGELVNLTPLPTHAFSILSKENKIYYGTSDANGVNTFQAKLIIIDLEGNPIAETEIEDHFWPEYNTSAVYNLTSTCDGGLVGTTDLQKVYWVDGEPDYSHENDLGLLKFDELGNMLWSRHYRFLNTERYYPLHL
ncbi:MAG: hypothetical protein NWR73_08545, partial [Flavobacteriales bacterium]|nr:hypothetical protein [Flavobacteriales bacterium]